MSGFVAVVSLGADAVQIGHEARGLANAYAVLRGGSLTEVRAESVGQAHALALDTEVVCDELGWTVLQGTAYGPCPHPVSAGEVVLQDGQFCIASHHAKTGRTVVATDRFGAAPVYVAERPGLLYVSTSAMAIARHLGAPADADAVRNFLVSGYQFGAETHWSGVRRLEPGHLVEVIAGRLTEHRYWQPVVDHEVEGLNLDQATERLLDVSVATLRERLGGRSTWADLTGGYDSRLLALLLHEADVPFTGNTRDTEITPDIELAGAIAAAKGWPWESMLVPDDWSARIPAAAHRALVAADGRLEILELSRVVWWHGKLAERMPHLLSAGGGEHLQYAAWKTELPFPGRPQANVSRWVDIMALKPTDLAVLAPGSRAATRTDHIDRLTSWIAPYRDEPSTRQLDLCYAYKSGGHFGAYRAADDLELTAELPFFFEPIFSTAFSMHHRHRGGFRLMRQMMYRLDPQLAAFRTTRGGPALPMRATTLPRYLPYYGLLLRKAVNKVSDLSVGRTPFPVDTPSPWATDKANIAVVEDLQRRGTLDWERLLIRPLLSADGIRRLRVGEAETGMLGRVLTAEMALAMTGTGL